MLELEDALTRILAALPAPVAESLPLGQAHGRFPTDPIPAPVNLPVFDNSSMDGFAVRASDVVAATPESPAHLRLAGRVPAGETFAGELQAGACVRLFTGSPLPAGADAVVMQEQTRIKTDRPDEVLVLEPVKAWENVRFQGEDVKRGAIIAEAGEVLTAARLAMLAAAGIDRVKVGRRPTVGLLATGSELREPGQSLSPGQVYESSRAGLVPLIERAGADAKVFPIVADTPQATLAALDSAFHECDLILSCGGVSVGELDLTRKAFAQLGGSLDFWRVAIKPGAPFAFGRFGHKWLFGLPGNPVSAFVTFLLLARPALRRWQGALETALPAFPGTLTEPLANPGSRRHFMRVRLDHAGQVRATGIQASHIMSSLAAANGLVDVAPRTTLAAGTIVPVLRWE